MAGLAFATPVEVSLRSGETFPAELVSVSEDCAGELRGAEGELRVLGTNALQALWFPRALGEDVGSSVQIQGLFPRARVRVDGHDAGLVEPGAVLAVSPGRHLIYINVPDCGRQRLIVQVTADQPAPAVYNRPIEQYYVPKAIVTTTVGVTYLLFRYVVPALYF